MKEFLIVIEKAERNFAAYSPDLPGCVATGKTRRTTEKNMREAIEFHLEGMIEDGVPIPVPHSSAAYIAMETSRRKIAGAARSRRPVR